MPVEESTVSSEDVTPGFESRDGLEALAKSAASSHRVALSHRPRVNIVSQLVDCRRILDEAHSSLSGLLDHDPLKTYISEWLLDNYYIVQRVIRDTPDDIPAGFYRKLPALAEGYFEGYPRIYAIAHTFLTANQCRLTAELMKLFLQVYQQSTPLKTSELWAFAPLMRICIIRILTASIDSLLDRESILKEDLPDVPLDVMVSNCIQSLHLLDALDWEEFHDQISLVEQGLRSEPSGVYARMDFESRDRYRTAVETLSESSAASETEVVRVAIDLAIAAQGNESKRKSHVGFYLVDNGRRLLEEKISYRTPFSDRIRAFITGYPTTCFFGCVSLVIVFIEAITLGYATAFGAAPVMLAAIAILIFIPAMTVAVSVINVLVTNLLPPHLLFKMDFRRGLPENAKTLLVVPAMLTKPDDVNRLVREIELHYLRNPLDNLWFALLTDFGDAPSQHMPNDKELVESVSAGIGGLNARYGTREKQPFLLLHRERRWNEAENIWMGWERKRGKLEELNRIILGRGETSYVSRAGDMDVFSTIKYVITLDADTILPQDGAAKLVGTLVHPLNAAEFDANTQKVVAGYTVLQPRPEIRQVSANRSRFTRIFAGDAGLDLYTRAVSDVYQDLFGEGIYVGKGVYDVSAFHRCTEGKIPENTLLSHDLFEGVLGRAGLVSDIVVFEDFPLNYFVSIRRLHRWIRGDWQLLPWLFPRVPHSEKGRMKNNFNALARWKIADNLRRSLLEISLLALLISSWFWLPGHPLVWALSAICVPAVPLLAGTFTTIARARTDEPDPDLRGLRTDAIRWAAAIVFLPYEAVTKLHAIGITLYRIFVTHANLLRWTTAAETEKRYGSMSGPGATWRQFRLVSGGSAIVFLYALASRSEGLFIAIPFLTAWILSPQFAYWLGNSPKQKIPEITEKDREKLRVLARKTWYFFERFVGPRDHWLPPDHFQEHPNQTVARRTSPTNIGLYCLSTLSAYELGYVDMSALFARLRDTFNTMDRMETYHGHLLNWYETYSLAPLPPRYVSTVDNGNLAACLIAVRQGITQSKDNPIPHKQRWEGLTDILHVAMESMSRVADEGIAEAAQLIDDLRQFEQTVQAQIEYPIEWGSLLIRSMDEIVPRLQDDVVNLLRTHSAALDLKTVHELNTWFKRVQVHLNNMHRELDRLAPWVLALCDAPAILMSADKESKIGQEWKKLIECCPEQVRLGNLETVSAEILKNLDPVAQWVNSEITSATDRQEALAWCKSLKQSLSEAPAHAFDLLNAASEISEHATKHLDAMDFRFLFDWHRKALRIGYNVDSEMLDSNCYDLLASEARITSLIVIARGDVPIEHWIHLDRPITRFRGQRALMSWNGSMFEYLMPNLFMRTYDHTLLDESTEAAVQLQIEYAREHGIPWGISESGYFHFDANMNYQYRGFGVPKLGIKRGLSEDLVVAPYAALLALAVRPEEVIENLAQFEDLGMIGDYGLYEAVDFTPVRQPTGQSHSLVRSFMAHHQGMILVSLTNYLKSDDIVRHFHEDPLIKSVELLLQEQIPKGAPMEKVGKDEPTKPAISEEHFAASPWHVPNQTLLPYVHFLSNGRLSTLITNRGSGYSVWDDRDITRAGSDATIDDAGTWIYLQDSDTSDTWAIGERPLANATYHRETQYRPHSAIFQSSSHGISTRMDIVISPDTDAEIRRLKLMNDSKQARKIRVTYSTEPVLATRGEFSRHSTFSKLFVESRFDPDTRILHFSRRGRSREMRPIHAAFCVTAKESGDIEFDFETDRYEFLGRGHNPNNPHGLSDPSLKLSSTSGRVRDPIAVLQMTIDLQPYESANLAFVMAVAESSSKAATAASALRDWTRIQHVFDQARIQSEVEMRELEMNASEIARIQRLLGPLMYPCMALRGESSVIAQNIRGQSSLWGFDISGDYPILLVKVRGDQDTRLLIEVLRAHTYWRKRHIKIDLVILNHNNEGYAQEDHGKLGRLIRRMNSESWMGRRGGIFLLRDDLLDDSTSTLLNTAASVVLEGSRGSLEEQLQALVSRAATLPVLETTRETDWQPPPTSKLQRPGNLLFDNTIGGFSPDGREYVMFITKDHPTPAPWINVIANPQFGTQISESGAGFTWSVNSGENRITPWMNDPVSDPAGEALYLRDEETGTIWSPTPAPAGDEEPYLVRHGAGYTTFEHNSYGLEQHVEVFVAREAPVKIIRLRIKNVWPHIRRLTATYFAEWVLGTNRENINSFIVPMYDHQTRALLAHNSYNEAFPGRTAFLASSRELHGLTTDRAEFLGRLGDRAQPAALRLVGLSGCVEAGVDPCAALQVHLDIEPDEEKELYFLLGEEADREAALRTIGRFQNPEEVERARRESSAFWDSLSNRIEVDTPDPAMNVLLNRWLLYQTLSCRIWGRTGLYQSSGAFGFRDQLQDVLALLPQSPEIARDHILRAARHQFEEGDVLHWWHPPDSRGVRTRISDDLLWLPYVTAQYVKTTGDTHILSECVPFLKGDRLQAGEHERYGVYTITDSSYTLYEHCLRALKKGLTHGERGLPLIGTGDWNDGMNRVGEKGQGESIWLGWFLISTLTNFSPLCESMAEHERATEFLDQAEQLRQAIEKHGWDGAWYRRAYYDDGHPLGSATNHECQVDSIAQSWAVLSGAAQPQRAKQAMESVYKNLVQDDQQTLLLFTPPFESTNREPGYIKGYPPGVRENGGQYTHAAIWSAWAFAELGDGDRAQQLFRYLNPIEHSNNLDKILRYRVEPYAIAADVYAGDGYAGRGGWTWYTGSASWMYRLGIEAILGFERRADTLRINPTIPKSWSGFSLVYRHGISTVNIRVDNAQGVSRGVIQIYLDGEEMPSNEIPLLDDGNSHVVEVYMGPIDIEAPVLPTSDPSFKDDDALHD